MDRDPLTRNDLSKLSAGVPLWLTHEPGGDQGIIVYVFDAPKPGAETVAVCREDPMVITCTNPDFIDPDNERIFIASTDQIPPMTEYYRAIRRRHRDEGEELSLSIIDIFDPDKVENREPAAIGQNRLRIPIREENPPEKPVRLTRPPS